jgi:hypothetical protein
MRRFAFLGIVPALIAAGGALAAVQKPDTASVRPSLRLVAGTPTMLRGRHFVAHEQITVVVETSASGKVARASKQLRAGADGGFTTTLPAAKPAGSCTHFEITATGSSGDHATYKVVPQCGFLPSG